MTSSNNNVIRNANNLKNRDEEFGGELGVLVAHNNIIAELISHDGSVEKSIRTALQVGSSDADGDGDQTEWNEFQTFLDSQRRRIHALAEMHIDTQQYNKAVLQSLNEITNETQKKDSDYQSIFPAKIEVNMTKIKSQANANSSQSQPHEFTLHIQQKLREPMSKEEQSDDEIEMDTTCQVSDFKCPVTGGLMTHPYRNKVCGHTYELDGIKFYLRTKNTCPVAGCSNTQVSMSDLEEDVELAMNIKRYARGLEREKRMRLSQTDGVEDLDGEDDNDNMDGNGNGNGNGNGRGFTVVE